MPKEEGWDEQVGKSEVGAWWCSLIVQGNYLVQLGKGREILSKRWDK